jgi:hypothetical protein
MSRECLAAYQTRRRRAPSRHNERLAMTPPEGQGDAQDKGGPGCGHRFQIHSSWPDLPRPSNDGFQRVPRFEFVAAPYWMPGTSPGTTRICVERSAPAFAGVTGIEPAGSAGPLDSRCTTYGPVARATQFRLPMSLGQASPVGTGDAGDLEGPSRVRVTRCSACCAGSALRPSPVLLFLASPFFAARPASTLARVLPAA